MKKITTLGLACALVAAGVSGADTIRPSSPLETIEDGTPMTMTYELKASAWALFIPVTGKATFNIDLKPDTYAIKGKVKTTGLADILVNYDMDLASSGYVRDEKLRTYAYVSQNHDGKKDRRVEMTYANNDVAMTAVPAFGNLGDPAATTAQKLDADDPVTALISFALEPRAPGADPCGGPMKIFDGRQLTWLMFENHGTKQVSSDAWKGEAIECHVTMDKVAGYKPGEANKDTLTGIDGPLVMWLAPLPNGAHVPVRIEAKTDKIGKVTLQASKLSFSPT